MGIKISIMKVIEIKHNNFEAIILKQGAQLVSFKINNQEQLLWHCDLSLYEKGKPFRGGIPICWPWFGASQKLNHGFARVMEWSLINKIDNENEVILNFKLEDNIETIKIWPHKFVLNLYISLSNSGIKLLLEVDADCKTTTALHSYFYVNDIDDITISGLDNEYFDLLENNILFTNQNEELKINKSIDRIYTKSKNTTILESNNQIIDIEHNNYSDVVIWNPWIEKSKDILDIKSNDYKEFICIETARINKPLNNKDFIGLEIKSMRK